METELFIEFYLLSELVSELDEKKSYFILLSTIPMQPKH